MKKKVAIIIPGGIGVGPQNQGIPILEALVERLSENNDITVFPLGKVNEGYIPKGFRLMAIQENYNQPLLKRMYKTVRLLRKSHKTEKFDWLHGIWTFPSGFLAVLFGKIWGLQSLVSLQGGGLAKVKSIKYGGKFPFLSRIGIQWTLKNAKHISAETYFQRNLIANPKIRERVKVIPYGVNMELFQFQTKTLKEPIQFIHIANLNPVKDQKTLIRAFYLINQHLNARLTIVGPDYMNGEIQRLTQRMGIQKEVHFTGFVGHERIPEYLNKAHVLLHTSLHEGMPLAAVEAMAAGVVVCGTKVGIIDDLSPVHCIGVPIEDYTQIAQEVVDLLNNNDHYYRLQQQARQWTEKHTIDWTCKEFEKIYKLNT